MRFLAFILLMLSSQFVLSDNRLLITDNDDEDFSCLAEIKNNYAEFTFIDEAKRYKDGITWNSESSSAIEHQWLVFFSNDKKQSGSAGEFDIGVRHFSRSGKKTHGALSDLFEISQTLGFNYGGDGMFLPIFLSKQDLTAAVQKENIVIRLNNSSPVFFDIKSNSANFWVMVNGEEPRKCKSEIKHSQ